MVVFTCNNCGDSLQKPKVEKHYSTVCRTVKNLTCVDCLKDFREEAYVAHTKCITEQERYSAKGSVTNVVGKGESKQLQWSKMIEEVIQNNSDVTGAQKFVFQIISAQTDHVPRKKNKFLNFIKNAGGNKIMYSDIESVWELIEKHKNDQNPSSTTETAMAADSTTDQHNGEEAEAVVDPENAEPSKKKKKKKNKAKKNDEIENADTTNGNEKMTDVSNGNDDSQVNSKEKKSKKRKSTDGNAANDQGQYCVNSNSTNGESKKKKKKSKSGVDVVVENCPSNDSTLNYDQGDKEKSHSNEISKKKKKKLQNLQGDEVEAKKTKLDQVAEITSESQVSTEKKKKKKSETSVENNIEETIADGNDNSVADNLTRITLKMLQKKNSLSLAKLQKKVIAEYCKEGNVPESPKLVKQFNKQIKKMEGVEVLDDNVTLKTLNEC